MANFDESGAKRSRGKFSNFTLLNVKKSLMYRKSKTSLKPPVDFSTKNDLDTYYELLLGAAMGRIAPDET